MFIYSEIYLNLHRKGNIYSYFQSRFYDRIIDNYQFIE